jgi:hypothetical protein
VIQVNGWDIDPSGNADDFMGKIFGRYNKSNNWGVGHHTATGSSKSGSFKLTYSIELRKK